MNRTPAPPAVVVEWMAPFDGGSSRSDADRAEVAAARALDAALARPGRDREGAFALLAADALLTYAAEDAADAVDPGNALIRILRATVEGME